MAVAATLLLLLSSAAGGATEPPAFRWDPLVDGALTVGSGVLWGTLHYGVEPGPPGLVTGTAPGGIDALTPTTWNPALDPASDALVYSTLAGGLLVAGLAARHSDDAVASTGVVLESFLITGLITDVVKVAVDRPRPYTWLEDPPPEVLDELATPDAFMSFPSGHTSFEASLSFSTASVLVAHGAPPLPTWTGATILTAGTGILRIASGRHYPTDVIAGAALGATVGLLVPALHRVDRRTPRRDLGGPPCPTPGSSTPSAPPEAEVAATGGCTSSAPWTCWVGSSLP